MKAAVILFVAAIILGAANADECQSCEDLVKPNMCAAAGYSKTCVPNMLNHTDHTQKDELKHMTEMLSANVWGKGDCGELLENFLCTIYLPPCLQGYSYTVPPCRSLCKRVRDACKTAADATESFTWPAEWECSQFPNYRVTLQKNDSQICFDYTKADKPFFRYYDNKH